MTRSTALLIAAPFALVLGLLLLLPLLIDRDTVLELATATLRERTGANLTVAGKSNLALFPTPGLTLGDASLALPGEAQPDLRVRSLDLRMRLLPLLAGRVEIDSLALDGLAVTIRSQAKAAPEARAVDSADPGDAGAAITLPRAFNVKQLTVTDSVIELVGSATHTGAVEFDTHTVSDLRATLRIADGVIRLSTLTAELYGGKLALQATFDGSHDIATLEISGQLEQADIAAALAASGAQPVLSGKASIDWRLASRGRTREELVAALTGPIRLAGSQVVLKDISIEQLLCQAVALSNQEQLTASFPADTAITTLDADIQLADGRARLDPLRAGLPQVALAGKGDFNLQSKDFRASFKAQLSPELETLDPACRVSKRLTAIDWPLDCKGNASGEPSEWCRVDAREVLEDLGENEVRRKLEKKAGKLLDKLFNR